MKDPKKQFYFFLLLIICGSSIPGKSIPSVINLSWDKLLHILEYAIMGWLAFRAFKEEIKSPNWYYLFPALFLVALMKLGNL